MTQPEIDDWVRVVAKLEPGSPRAAYYVKWWNVPEKIRAAKLSGKLDELINPEPPREWRRAF